VGLQIFVVHYLQRKSHSFVSVHWKRRVPHFGGRSLVKACLTKADEWNKLLLDKQD
jgi:hypothetical protein